jgi:hypothetical protein
VDVFVQPPHGVEVEVEVELNLRPTVSRPDFCFLSDSCGFLGVGRPL